MRFAAIESTLAVNKLVDLQWKFGVTAASSDIQLVGNTFLQVRSILPSFFPHPTPTTTFSPAAVNLKSTLPRWHATFIDSFADEMDDQGRGWETGGNFHGIIVAAVLQILARDGKSKN